MPETKCRVKTGYPRRVLAPIVRKALKIEWSEIMRILILCTKITLSYVSEEVCVSVKINYIHIKIYKDYNLLFVSV